MGSKDADDFKIVCDNADNVQVGIIGRRSERYANLRICHPFF